jgi:hypothetical protein
MAMIKLPSEPPATSLNTNFDRDDAVILLVGSSEHAILAHGSFLACNSDYFEAALKKEWAEGQERTITLADECPEIISHYLKYTYTNKLPTSIFVSGSMSTFIEKYDEFYELLAKLYVLGERFLDECIRAGVLKEIIRLSGLSDKDGKAYDPAGESANIIYRGTTAGSPARRLMVDIHLVHGTSEWLDSTYEPDLLLDIAQGFYRIFERNKSSSSIRGGEINQADYLS